MPDRLFTPRFLIMFGFSFTVFLSVFQLLPTAPYRVLAMGGTTATAGLFHGMLTYSSAFSAPLTGPITDRLGHRPILIWVSLALAGFTLSYAWIDRIGVMLTVVVVHGIVWSALLSASSAYMTATVPTHRRAEGLAYWGLSSVLAIGAAPAVGFWVYRHGWTALCVEMTVLNLLMAAIAWWLPDDRVVDAEGHPHPDRRTALERLRQLDPFSQPIEWRVMGLSIGMGLISFGYGSITSFSALFADELGVSPRSLFLSAMAVAILLGRLTVGRTLDRRGHRNVLLRCLLLPPLGLAVLAFAQGKATMVVAALIFGAGFGLMHPAYAAYVMNHVAPGRRGAAFGAMLAAFDTGIGTGASLMGWLIHAHGFRVAFAAAAVLAALSMPYFILAERRLGFRTST
jgi:MFS family permease